MTFNANTIRADVRAKAQTARDICWAFNAHPMVKERAMTVGERVEMLVNLFNIKRSNALIETRGYAASRGNRFVSDSAFKHDIAGRPNGGRVAAESDVIDF
ncbi:hypothetical protein EJ069_10330 [Mesorhizobium sp. M2A.F.Ca.ET.043.05.1.1]|uniref:hypothetical protein n=1 Tax=Mesorhizobium sp. M2A.F.Ca.ET.043.05.1.1 TaxID=2493671 RepID=UPI000F762131|nr:hypothetical protein [Mesorhizobium sp. M2A.F.Ca.ET.043.05.1.1]AZO15091.1 hypothetical protein EJ069_10330 [Mesorhizobium sp. M2A.F.Ca.ET.043.05.1.1]